MNKIIIAAAATAALATYLIARRRARTITDQPMARPVQGETHHLTNVFAKAKKYNM